MIPLSLTLQGLYSYQEKQTIDFTQLTGAHLFGIFGATGSGKSSILEAISYALYGQSERLNQRDNRGYNMMNLKSDQLFIDFHFQAEDHQYRFTVQGKRNSKRFDTVSTLERKAFQVEGDTLIPLDYTTAEPILGLSYDNFKRTIIIPQGKFQEFLQLTETDRTRMLKEIFSLEKYELYRKTVTLESKNETHISQKETLILQLAGVTSEAVQETGKQIGLLENELNSLTTSLKQNEKQLNKQSEVRILFEKIAAQKENQAQLLQQETLFEQKAKNLNAYESCLLDFKPLLDRKHELSVQFERTNQTVLTKKETQQQLQKDLSNAEETFNTISKEYQQRELFTQRADELEAVIRLKEVEKNTAVLDTRIQKGQDVVTQNQQEIEQLRAKAKAHATRIREIRDQTPDLENLLAIRDWFTHQQTFLMQKTQAEQLLQEAQAQSAEISRKKTEILKGTSLDASQYNLSITKINALLHDETHRLDQLRIDAEKAREHWLTQSRLKTFAEKLEEGSPCPLCGATHHPEVIEIDQVDFHLQQSAGQIQTLNQEILDQKQRIARLEALEGQSLQAQQIRAERSTHLQSITRSIDQHKASFIWKDFRQQDALAVNTQIAEIANKNQQISLLNQEKEAFEISISNEEQNREKFQKALEGIRQQKQHLEIQFQSGKQSLKLINYSTASKRDNLDLEQDAVAQREKYKQIANLHTEYEKRIQQLRTNVDVLKGEISELEKQARETSIRIAQLNQQLNQRLQATTFSEISTVIKILDQNLNIETEKNAINQFRQHLHSATSGLAELQALAKDKVFDADQFRKVSEQIESLNQQITEKNILVGGLKNELKRLESDLEQKTQHQLALEKLKLRADDLRTLKNMFSRSGFVNYVSTIYLQNLCLAANERFVRLTRGAFSLEPTAGNSFQVRDYLNNGQVRSAKTLSGGQTFQAALSLALSLADHVQQQARAKQNFFFLDEGFGSQDKKSLQVIFDTLKSLRKENRVVGVISHVEELQEEIGAYLFIHNDEETGSQISSSWEM